MLEILLKKILLDEITKRFSEELNENIQELKSHVWKKNLTYRVENII